MAKKVYKVVRLMPNVSSWCDLENNIYLSVSNKTFKRLKDGCDMKMINKGVKAGLISLEEHCEEVKEVSEKIKEIKSKVKKTPAAPKKENNVEVKVDVNPVKPVEEVKQKEEVIEPQKEEVKKEEVKKNSDK